uniref:Uncharacterized protein n=1 Tax=Opuntia streptacantha TaxID=393608 RepID=A0A7C8Z7L2_OPUST
MLPLQCFDILDFKCLNIKLIHPQKSNGICDVKSAHKSINKIDTLLHIAYIRCVTSCFEFNSFKFNIHPDVHLQLLIDGGVDFHPCLFERRQSVGWYWDSSKLHLTIRHLMSFQSWKYRLHWKRS